MVLATRRPAFLPISSSSSRPSLTPASQRLHATPVRPVKLERRHAIQCRAEDGSRSAVTDVRKIDVEKGGLTHTLRETVFTPETLVPVAIGVGGAVFAGYGQDGVAIGKFICNESCSSALTTCMST